MQIIDHRLYKSNGVPYPYTRSANHGGEISPEYIILHYTAGASISQSTAWLTNSASKASVHVIIGRDGSIHQLVPFNRQAWHAGTSEWEGRIGLNDYSIGIEMDNAGRLNKQGQRWRSWFGQEYGDNEVIEMVHKHESDLCGWHIYTPAQIQSALELCVALFQHYPTINDVVGHDDISPGRKSDPGPAFPMNSFRSRILGRHHSNFPIFVATTDLNIRSGPGAQYPTIKGSPLPVKTPVEILSSEGRWRFVDVRATVNGIHDLQGWVHCRFLNRATGEHTSPFHHG